MKINRRYKLEKAASKDSIRPAMQCIRIKNNIATATNGHILAEVPVEGYDNDTELLISAEEWDFIQKYGKIKTKDKILPDYEFEIDNGNICSLNHRFLAVRNKLTELYPNTESVKPKADDKIEYSICFNPWKLMELVQALGIKKDDSIELKFYGRTKSIVIKPNIYGESKEYGLLMPVRPSD